MKSWGSWGSIIVTAVGFLAGVVLAGVGGLSAKTHIISSPSGERGKKIEKYWAETGLGEKELFDLISNSNCQSTEKYFLACVNSVAQNLANHHKYISELTGTVEKLDRQDTEEELSEKQRLLPYTQMYVRQVNQLIDFEKIWKQMLNEEPKESQAYLIANGINAFLSVYKDPHTYILPDSYYDEVSSQLERVNTFVGISFEKFKSKTLIRKIFKNSDAERGGLMPFDEVLSINGQSLAGLNQVEISQLLKDTSAKKFSFELIRSGERKSIEVVRTYQNLSHVQFEVLSGLKNFAVITLTKFSRGVCEEMANKLKANADKDIAGLVLDLRDNPGGQLDEAACIAGLFLGMNKRAYSVEFFDPLKSNEVVLSTGSLLYTGPLVIAINNSSASASELLAGALKDYRRALIVGEKTFGKGTFQESEIWSKNPKVSLFKTQGYYLLPSRTSTQLTGVQPDVEVDEQHLKLREENLYFNPLPNTMGEVESDANSQRSYVESLAKCLDYSEVISRHDPVLQKSLQVLSCHSITSLLAQQYNPTDFN